MITLSTEPQFSAKDILEIPAGVGRTDFEFDKNLIEVCHPLFEGCYDSHRFSQLNLFALALSETPTGIFRQRTF